MIKLVEGFSKCRRKMLAICAIPSMSLRCSLAVGFGAVLGLFALVLGFAIFGERTTVEDFNRLLAVDIKTAALSQKSVVAMMNARRYEKAFLMTYHEFGFEEAKSRYVTLVQANLADARQSLQEIRHQVSVPHSVSEVRLAVEGIDNYETAFVAIVKLHGQLGYIDTGLEGEFRDKARRMEALLTPVSERALLIDMLTIRRHEKDYLWRRRAMDIQAFQLALDQLKKHVSVEIKGERRKKLLALIDLYEMQFNEYIHINSQIEREKRRYLAAAQTIEPYLENMLAEAVAKSNATRNVILKRAVRTEKLIEGVGLVAIVLGILMAWMVSQRITAAIRRTITFAKSITAGDLRTRTYTGQDEFGVLGRSLNHMANALQEAIQAREDRATELQGINGILKNEIIARKQAEFEIRESNAELEQRVLSRTAALAKSEKLFRQLAELTSDWYWEQDANFCFVLIPNVLVTRSGAHIQNYVGRARWDMPTNLTAEQWAAHREILNAHQKFSDFEFQLLSDAINPQWLSVSGEPQFDAWGEFTGYQGTGKDISERKRIEESIKHLSLHDVLTGLPNRALLHDRLAQALTYAARYTHAVWIVFIDLDDFKIVNDTLGHKAGDKVLSLIAKRLQSAVRESDTVARLGGDEFVLVLAEHTHGDEILGAIERIMKKLRPPLMIGQEEITVGCSIGISSYPRDGIDADALVDCADVAMYRAKQQGRNNIQFYEIQAKETARTKSGFRDVSDARRVV